MRKEKSTKEGAELLGNDVASDNGAEALPVGTVGGVDGVGVQRHDVHDRH